MAAMLKLLIVWAVVGLAPVPADPPPDPLGWGYLGVRFEDQRLPNGDGAHLRLTEVVPASPAAKAGMRVGDELVRISGRRPASQWDAIRMVATIRPGSVVRLEVRRAGLARAVFVRVGARPSVDAATGESYPSPFGDR